MADYFQKQERNLKEDAQFAQKIDDFISLKLPANEVIKVGTTPYCLRVVGAGVMPLMLSQSVLSNSMGIKSKLSGRIKLRHTEPHDISAVTMKSLPHALRTPICICKGNQPDTLVVVTDLIDDDNHNIVVPIKLDVKGLKGYINRIESIYGRKNLAAYLNKALETNCILALNAKKADKCFPNFSTNIGRQLSKFETLICFTDSIAYSDENVKTVKEFFLETKSADLSAKRGEIGGKTMEHATKFEVSSISKIENGTNVKALASVVINGELAVRGIKVMEGENGAFVAMPSKKYGSEYHEMAFPITAEARETLNNVVMDNYNKLIASPEKTLKNELPPAERSSSSIKVKLKPVENENYSSIKAVGRITVDSCFVVNDVKVMTNSEDKAFVSMPSYQTNSGDYSQYAFPITKELHEKLDKAVMGEYQSLGKVEYRGVKYAELGGKDDIAHLPKQNNKFAEKLMGELDKAGVKYQAKIEGMTTISVNKADKAKLDSIKSELVKKLNPEKPKQTEKKDAPAPKRSRR